MRVTNLSTLRKGKKNVWLRLPIQVAHKPGTLLGDEELTPGGRALMVEYSCMQDRGKDFRARKRNIAVIKGIIPNNGLL